MTKMGVVSDSSMSGGVSGGKIIAFAAARPYVTPDPAFIGVMGTRHGADAYFADDTDVCLWYTIQMGDKSIPACGWYHLVNEKISNFRVLFDPRPLLH